MLEATLWMHSSKLNRHIVTDWNAIGMMGANIRSAHTSQKHVWLMGWEEPWYTSSAKYSQ